MHRLSREQYHFIEPFLPDERPGPLIGQHLLETGIGCVLVDDCPNPQGLVLEVAGNYTFLGSLKGFSPQDLQSTVLGFLDASADFEPLINTTFPDVSVWERIIYSLAKPLSIEIPPGIQVRCLTTGQLSDLQNLSSSSAWITTTWDGPEGMAASGRAWGAYAGGRLVSVACPFFVGKEIEDIGVVTEPEYRNRGLTTACASKLCNQILENGKKVSWTTSLDNGASRRVAEKLGFIVDRLDRLFVIGIDIPD